MYLLPLAFYHPSHLILLNIDERPSCDLEVLHLRTKSLAKAGRVER